MRRIEFDPGLIIAGIQDEFCGGVSAMLVESLLRAATARCAGSRPEAQEISPPARGRRRCAAWGSVNFFAPALCV
jgi:hypothetical protein